MRQYQFTPNFTLTLKAGCSMFKWFAGKTNRLALYHLSMCGLELELYIARHWEYPAWEESSEYVQDAEHAAITALQSNRRTLHLV